MRVRHHPDARAELLDEVEWYEERRPLLGADFLNEVRRAETMIARHPAAWQRWPGVVTECAGSSSRNFRTVWHFKIAAKTSS